MISSKKLNPQFSSSGFHTTKWRFEDIFILLTNGFLLVFLFVSTGKLIFELWTDSIGASKNELWIAIILLFMAYVFNLAFAKGSVRVFEKSGEISNITQILRVYSIYIFGGFSAIYWVIICKLSETDYAFDPEYIQYILILALGFACVRYYASIPNKQDVLVFVSFIFVIIFVHLSRLISQYIFLGTSDFRYFFQDFMVLLGMTVAASYTLFGKWKEQPK